MRVWVLQTYRFTHVGIQIVLHCNKRHVTWSWTFCKDSLVGTHAYYVHCGGGAKLGAVMHTMCTVAGAPSWRRQLKIY